jgi:hypothetical protein
MTLKKELTRQDAIDRLWDMGELSWKLKGKQKEIYDAIVNGKDDVVVILVSRRSGKSFTNCLTATEYCLKNPNSIVKYACPQQRMVKTIIKPIMREIFKDAPAKFNVNNLWHEQDKVYRFPNGSEIQIAGTDSGNAENLRGGYAHLCILDEAGFMDDLDYVVNSILLPTTDTTNGKLILTSTPNYKDPNHEFHENFVIPAQAENKIVKFTVYDSPMVTPAKIAKIINRYPLKEADPKFRCEYLCEIARSSDSLIVPEFNEEVKKNTVTPDIELPAFYDAYVSMDVGFRDLTVALFGYYDFKKASLVILDELVMNGPDMTTSFLAERIKLKEKTLFYDEKFNEIKEPYLRIMDNDLKLINDLSRLHGLNFIATDKDNKEAAVNNLRIWIQSGRIKIHPRCKTLIYHVESGQWDKSRKKFMHLKNSPSGQVMGGHCDALDALIYLVRNIIESKNPYPDNYGLLQGSSVIDTGYQRTHTQPYKDFMNKILNIKGK